MRTFLKYTIGKSVTRMLGGIIGLAMGYVFYYKYGIFVRWFLIGLAILLGISGIIWFISYIRNN